MVSNQERARFILLSRNPAFQKYVPQLYEFLRAINPVHFVGEKGVVAAAGKEPVLGGEASRLGALNDILLYLVVLKGVAWAMKALAGVVVGPAEGAGELVIQFPKGGKIKFKPGEDYNPEELASAVDRASAGETVTVRPVIKPGKLVTADGTPVAPTGTGRAINIYGEREAKGFEDFAIDKTLAGDRPLTSDLPDHVASDICMRDAPLTSETTSELQRIANPGARVTSANADVEGFEAYVDQLMKTFPNAKIVEQGTITDSNGVRRGVVVLEIP